MDGRKRGSLVMEIHMRHAYRPRRQESHLEYDDISGKRGIEEAWNMV